MHLNHRPPIDGDLLTYWTSQRQQLAQRITVVNQTTSTNDLARQSVQHDAGGPSLATLAEHQTAGRGQRGRAWSAPPRSSLLMTITVAKRCFGSRLNTVSLWPAVALAEVLASHLDFEPTLKWPNDVLLQGRKVAGILVESTTTHWLVGLGINVSILPEEFPTDLRRPATSLQHHTVSPIDRTVLANLVFNQLEKWMPAPADATANAIENRWLEYSHHQPQKDVRLQTKTGKYIGQLQSFHPRHGAEILLRDKPASLLIPAEQILSMESSDG